jgi:hypothetical protein
MMVKKVSGSMLGAFMGTICLAFSLLAGIGTKTFAHSALEHYTAGEPGDPKKPFRVVKVTMLEDGKKMLFEPAGCG